MILWLQEHDFRTLPSIDFRVLICSPLRGVKTLGFLKEHHSRTQIWGSNLSDMGGYLILRVFLYLVSGLEHEFFDFLYIGNFIRSQLTNSYFSEG